MAMMLMTQTALLARSGQQGMAPQQQGMTGDIPCPSPPHVCMCVCLYVNWLESSCLHIMTVEDKLRVPNLLTKCTDPCMHLL